LGDLLGAEKRWVQSSTLVVLVAGLLLVAWLLRKHQTEFIYALF
jgi:hypothetical protein